MVLKILITLLVSVNSAIDWEAAKTISSMIADSQFSVPGGSDERDKAILQWLKARLPKSFANIQITGD